MMKRLGLLVLATTCLVGAEPSTLVEWTFDQGDAMAGWSKAHHMSELRVEDGALTGKLVGKDPWVRSPKFEIAATPWQRLEFRLKTDCGGSGEIYFTDTTETQYGGFTPGKRMRWKVNGDGQWHRYTVYPFWGAEKKIIMLRFDLAPAEGSKKGASTFALDWLRVVGLDEPMHPGKPPAWTFPDSKEMQPTSGLSATPVPEGLTLQARGEDAWLESPFMSFPSEEASWAVVRMAATAGDTATISWISSQASEWKQKVFGIIPDGKMRSYNVDLSDQEAWTDDIYLMGFRPPVGEGKTTLAGIAIQDEPGGPAMPVLRYAGLEDAISRAGHPASLLVALENQGGEDMKGVRIDSLSLPPGVAVVGPQSWRDLPDLATFERYEHRIQLSAKHPVQGNFSLEVSGSEETVASQGELEFLPALGLPKADYVPEPKPVESEYEIGAFYFPGWPSVERWARIWPTDFQRKPVLGWYDEANPEVVDWQIKWAVENGIQFFMVDWYWHKGSTYLEHWIRAYEKARYRKYLKWCLMYANHNPKGSHSEEDQRAVTRYWIENFFGMPEYYRIDDKPVVIYWSPAALKRDMGGDSAGVRKLLEISRRMAREAGYKGIYFICMKWPEASTDPEDIEWLSDAGFDMTSIYHLMYHGGEAGNPRRFPFRLVADCSYDWWEARRQAGVLPFLPNLSTGWHSRPWHGERGTWILDRNVADFRRICGDAKKFADETGIKRLVLGPLNEWGEGSYAEPNKEFGFGMYEAVRDTFCREPASGWPLNYAPADVGLGPYDLPIPGEQERTVWDFADGPQGWRSMMGIGELKIEDGRLRMVTASVDPAVTIRGLLGIRARDYSRMALRMRITPPPDAGKGDTAQLFWRTTTSKIREAASAKVAVPGDGEFHDCVFELAENPLWRGRIEGFRLDPCSRSGAVVEIEEIRLVK